MRVRLKLPRLVELIARGGLSQNHWALRLGLSRGHWSAIVNGKHLYPSAKTRVRLLEVFQVPLEDLFEVERSAAWADVDFRRAIAERYLIDSELGQGGMGAVYLARDVRHGRTVAVKVIAAEAVSGIGLVQFQREISTVAKLQHSNVLPLFDSGEAAGCPYYVMPLVRGGSLRALLSAQRRLGLEQVLKLAGGMASALDYAHGEHVLHCDIKPENVLLQGTHAWLMDFGIARKLRTEASAALPRNELDFSAGTPAYVSPEQASGDRDLDGRSDVYSLGCMVFEMLSGRTPFEGTSTRAIVSQRFIVPPPPLRDFAPELPDAVERVVERAMALPRERRQASAADFVAELEAAAVTSSRLATATSIAATRIAASVRRRIGANPIPAYGGMMQHLFRWADLREASRALARAPVVTICAVICLGLGLGATTAMYSAVDRALVRPLPFPEPERLVSVFRTTPQFASGPFSAPNYLDLAAVPGQLEALAAATPTTALLRLPGEAVRVPGHRVSGTFFQLLGVRALSGRLLQESDDDPAAEPAIVISEELWRRQFGAAAAVVGSSMVVNGLPSTVVGIAPRGLRVPHGNQMLRGDAWVPLRFSDAELAQRRSNYLYLLGRLAPGAAAAGADAELRARFDAIVEANPGLRGEQVQVLPVQAEALAAVRMPLLLVFGSVCFVMLIAAANVASLLLARGVGRRREMAIRSALGGGRWALIRPVLVESLLLAAAGSLMGLGLAWISIRTIGTLAAARIPQLDGLALDGRLFAVLCALAVLVALLCAVAPAWYAAAVDPQDALRGGTGGGPGKQHHRALAGLVVAEVALALVLLLGTGLVLRGFVGLLQREPGFDPDGLLTLEVTVSPDQYPDGTAIERFLEPVLAAIEQVPGVGGAAAINLVPYVNWGWNFNIRYEGQPGDETTRLPITERRVVSPGFGMVIGQRLVAGRYLESSDDALAPAVVVVNEALVRRDFPGGDAIGRRFHTGDTTFATIVGVVSDIRNFGPVAEPRPEIQVSWRQGGRGSTTFPIVIRAADHRLELAGSVQSAIRGIDAGAAIVQVYSMADLIGRSVGRPRFYLTLLGAFAAVALILTMAGVYGVISYTVAQRTRELGIRTALGSTTGRTVVLVARGGAMLVGIGLAAGLAGGLGLTRLLRGLLYGVSPLDPLAWVSGAAALAVAGLLAALLPALRASRVDPVVALKGEGG